MMFESLLTTLVSVALFVVTNIDDLALLVAFFAIPGISKRLSVSDSFSVSPY